MAETLYGFRFSPTCQEILHVIALTGANIALENVPWKDINKNTALGAQTPTRTLPFLKTKQGNLSEVKAINYYLAETYQPTLLGSTDFERAQVHQWVEFAEEFNTCAQDLIFPLFGWKCFCQERARVSEEKVIEFMKALDAQVKGKRFVMGEKVTLADAALFRALKFYFQFVFPEGKRKAIFRNADDWFRRVYNTPEVDAVYGEFQFCKVPLKPVSQPQAPKENAQSQPQKKEGKKKDNKEQQKKEKAKEQPKIEEKKPKKNLNAEEETADTAPAKKPKNPLDELPPSKLELETFKRAFLNNKDYKDAITKFFNDYDPEGYSIYRLEYDNLPSECKVLFRTNNAQSVFIQKCNPACKYLFGNLGVYGEENDYKIRGVWMFRGKGVPQILKECNDGIEYYLLKELDLSKEEDKKLVEEYWNSRKEGDIVEGRRLNTFQFVH